MALSGDPADIAATDAALLELFPEDERLQAWLRYASKEIAFQGAAGEDLLVGIQGARQGWVACSTRWCAKGRVSAPIVIGRGTTWMRDRWRVLIARPRRCWMGRIAVSDWALLNFATGVASGAGWMSFHHGGGVGMGYSQHAGAGRGRGWKR